MELVIYCRLDCDGEKVDGTPSGLVGFGIDWCGALAV
jgi:hypothetical protein